MVKVALVQHDVAFEDPAATCSHLKPLVKAAARGADLVVLTEMFATGFSMAAERIAQPSGDAVGVRFLLDMAAGTGAAVCGSLPLRENSSARPVNRFLCAFPDGRTVGYDKVHPFSYGGEDKHYAAGSSVSTFRWQETAVTPFVCYDLRFADLFWAAAASSDCYLVVANWPASRQAHFRALAVARAIENQAYVLATNRVGTGGGVVYSGGTIAVGPLGEVLAEAGEEEETLLVDVSAARVRGAREAYPFLADRRPFSVGPLISAEPFGTTVPERAART
ncbi:MAG TPA: nitrilase-related carbon-nitrogen hydrolase [Acidimicrobiales bacterium]|nr:nitrilase-related carbon-nitrogen hydrolase [Acidimicrobiales bacterium]